MSRWFALIDPDHVARTPLGVRGHNLLLTPRGEPRALLLGAEEAQLIGTWLGSRASRVRWSTLLAATTNPGLAEDLLRRLLEAGWCEIELHAEAGLRQSPLQPFWVSWRDMYGLRSLTGLVDPREQAETVALWRGWQPRNAELAGLADSLGSRLPTSTLERRLKLAQALDSWLGAGQWGSERQFSQHAFGRSKAFNAGDRDWLASHGIELDACGITEHAPHLFLSGPLTLLVGAEPLVSARLLGLGVALAPEALLAVTALQGSVRGVRVVQNLSVFEGLTRAAQSFLTVWVPGYPHRRWRAAVGHLLALLRLPLQVACDLDPAGIAIALQVGAVAEQAGCVWQPWKMEAEALTLANGAQPLTEQDAVRLARLEGGTLPPPLAKLAEAIRERQHKVDQEGLFLERLAEA
ncbi:DUF2399 domain-containing protein [Pseudogulbenkiania subflava]|uniref:DUF2399 domain-containing protein n=1 Tax=Pseudogulbenkiania subflava DSM 22618 TaxID=1123014 RepID=A0A1Y6BAY4_9NEIS|nr:DUF2399 domain-containing protein [Pseudogulbenkiania subflava]SMF01964.1 Protein of unknown function C-terminus [Pseudogulbenkiania subflava DSM 22618]